MRFWNEFQIISLYFSYFLSHCGGFKLTSILTYFKIFYQIPSSNQIIPFKDNPKVLVQKDNCNYFSILKFRFLLFKIKNSFVSTFETVSSLNSHKFSLFYSKTHKMKQSKNTSIFQKSWENKSWRIFQFVIHVPTSILFKFYCSSSLFYFKIISYIWHYKYTKIAWV